MSFDQNRTQTPTASPHHTLKDARSATPSPVDTRGQRQRTKQYTHTHQAQLDKIKRENPDIVKHKRYTNSYASKRRKNHALVLVLVVFLCFSLSLLAVYGIATMLKRQTVSGIDTDQTQGSSENANNVTYALSEQTTEATLPPDEPPVVSVYAQVTDSTKNLGSNVVSTNAILISLDSHTVIAQKSSGDRIYPASMTKIMTLLVAAERMTSLDQTATVTFQTTDYCYQQGASVVGFSADETVTMEDLLYGTILPSGADATMTLAECIAGSEEAFVRMMNDKATELGLTGTHFVNTSGLHHPDHYSTVHDIAIILKAAMDNDVCFKVLSTSHYVTSETTQHPTGIPLYSIVHQRTSIIKLNEISIVGGKTGYTPEAGQCLATYAITEDNREFIFVSASGPAGDKLQPAKDAEYAYKTFAVSDNKTETETETETTTDIAA